MGRSRSRSPRKKSSRKRSRSRERKRRRHRDASSDSDSDHKRRRDKTSTGHRRRSRSRSHDRHKHDRRRRSRSQDRQSRKKSCSPVPDKETKQEDTSKLSGAEKVRVRLKMLLEQQEKKKKEEDQAVIERILTVPSSAEIAKIDNESFHQQKFKSGTNSLTAKQSKKSSLKVSSVSATTATSELDHDNAIFGSRNDSLSITRTPVVQEEPITVPVKELPCSDKQARWLQKLQKMRSKFPKPPSDEPIQLPD